MLLILGNFYEEKYSMSNLNANFHYYSELIYHIHYLTAEYSDEIWHFALGHANKGRPGEPISI